SVSTEGVEELKRIVRIKGVKKEALHNTLGGSLLQPPSTKTKCSQIESRANKRSIINLIEHNVNMHLSNIIKFTGCNERVLRSFLKNLLEHLSDTKVFTIKMEILLEPTSKKLLKDSNYLIHSYRVVCFETFRIRRWRYNLIQAESKFKNPMLDYQDKFMMKAQVHVLKSSAISDEQALPQRKHHC
nr:hypothetical protein [Tanacetum cinerariifolium]